MYPGGHMIWMAIGWTIGLAIIAVLLWSLMMLFKVLHEPPSKTKRAA